MIEEDKIHRMFQTRGDTWKQSCRWGILLKCNLQTSEVRVWNKVNW